MIIDDKELAKYIWKEIQDLNWITRGEFFSELPPDALAFWIQQFKTRGCNGHSEWSERFQRNIWIKDEDE